RSGEGFSNGDGATVGLRADAPNSSTIDEPRASVRLDGTGEVLRLDHHDPAWPDHDVVDVAGLTGKGHVVQEEVVVRQAPEALRDDCLARDPPGDLAKTPVGLPRDGGARDCLQGAGQGLRPTESAATPTAPAPAMIASAAPALRRRAARCSPRLKEPASRY